MRKFLTRKNSENVDTEIPFYTSNMLLNSHSSYSNISGEPGRRHSQYNLACQGSGPEFNPQKPYKKPRAVVWACHPSSGDAEGIDQWAGRMA